MWTYTKAWRRSVDALHVEIEGPASVVLSDGSTLEAEMLVKGFGAPLGTLVFPLEDLRWLDRHAELRELGYTASSFGPYEYGVEATTDEVVEVLSDWGWCGGGEGPAWLIRLDASQWRLPADLYDDLLPKLKSPNWHGKNLDALWDSLVSGDINGLPPPFAVQVFGSESLPAEQRAYLERVAKVFSDARTAGVPVSMVVWP